MKLFFHRNIFLIVALLFGVLLRIYQLSDQIIVGDEWHAIHMAMRFSYQKIATTFGTADHSIPISLYYEFVMNNFGLTQTIIQLPFFVFGSLSIVILPILVRPYIGNKISDLFALFIAFSPFLILYSRFARPYIIVLLFAMCAVVFFFQWWKTSKTRYAISYVVSTALCGYLLLPSLPFVLSPFLFFFVHSIFDNDICVKEAIKRLFILGLITTGALALLLLPPIVNDFSSLISKTGKASLTILDLLKVLPIYAGNGGLVITSLFLFLSALGLTVSIKKGHLFIIYLTCLSFLQIVSIYYTAPLASQTPYTMARYLILIMPLLFILATSGILTLIDLIKNNKDRYFYIAGIGFLCITFLLGPIPKIYTTPNNAITFMFFAHIALGEDPHLILKEIPQFYRKLGERGPGTTLIVEAPHYYDGYYLPLYQKTHRQNMAMGYLNGLCSKERSGEVPHKFANRIRLNNYYYLEDIQSLMKDKVEFVIFHKDPKAEVSINLAPTLLDISECVTKYQEMFGLPYFEDSNIIVFFTGEKS